MLAGQISNWASLIVNFNWSGEHYFCNDRRDYRGAGFSDRKLSGRNHCGIIVQLCILSAAEASPGCKYSHHGDHFID